MFACVCNVCMCDVYTYTSVSAYAVFVYMSLDMCSCVCMCDVYTHASVSAYAVFCICLWMCVHVFVCMHVHGCVVHVHVCTCLWLHVVCSVCMCACEHVCGGAVCFSKARLRLLKHRITRCTRGSVPSKALSSLTVATSLQSVP